MKPKDKESGDVERFRLRQVTNRDGRAIALDRLTLRSRHCRAVRATGSTQACSRPVKGTSRKIMDTVDLKLAQDCEALAVAASEGVAWLKDAANSRRPWRSRRRRW